MFGVPGLPSVTGVNRTKEEGAMNGRIGIAALTIALLTGGTMATASDLPMRTSLAQCTATWPAPADAAARAEAAMLPTYEKQPTRYRAAARLSVTTDGVRRVVPAGIGMDLAGGQLSPLHTVTCDGVVRVDAPAPLDVHLWQLFEEWGVRLTQHCIEGTCAPDGVRIVLNGRAVRMCPGAISIEPGTRIDLSV
jgi:hypothetical protein